MAMAEAGVEEADFESDSDGTSTLVARRRQASDEEEEEERREEAETGGSGAGEAEGPGVPDAASSVDDEGSRGPPYSDEEGEGDGEALEDEEDEDEGGVMVPRRRRKGSDEEEENGDTEEEEEEEEEEGGVRKNADSHSGAAGKNGAGEEKKEAEPFVVPSAGAFYMHDDRFRDSGGARPRRSLGGRKLWEAKDEKPWVHDMFEELNIRSDLYAGEGGRRSGRGLGRGRGRGKGRGRGGSGSRAFVNDESTAPRGRRGRGRGRGTRSENADRGRDSFAKANNQSESTVTAGDLVDSEDSNQPAAKQLENSTKKPLSHLSSASPPFFPSGAVLPKLVGKDEVSNATAVKVQGKLKDGQGSAVAKSSVNRAASGSGAVYVSKTASSSGKGSSTGHHLSSSARGDAGTSPKRVASVEHQLGKASSSVQQQQSPQVQGKSQLFGISQTTAPMQPQQSGKGPSATRTQSLPQPQQSHQAQGQISSSRTSVRVTASGVGTFMHPGNNSCYKPGGGRGGMGGNPQLGRGQYVFNNGASSGLHVGETGYVAAPVGPVALQYAGQSQAGIGVPAVGMALPNYSGQPPYGYANSEVTWVPVIAQGAGVGGGFGSPYIAIDGAPAPLYYAQPSAQASSYRPAGKGELMSGSKLWKPPPSPDLGNDEFGQRQSKPRSPSTWP